MNNLQEEFIKKLDILLIEYNIQIIWDEIIEEIILKNKDKSIKVYLLHSE